MAHRTPARRSRSQIGLLLPAMLVSVSCTRGERNAPPSGARGTAAASRERSSKVSSQSSPAVPGFDSVIKQQRPGSACYVGSRYVVVERDLDDEAGSDLYIRPRGVPTAAPRCGADSTGGDIVFRTGEAASRHPDAQHFLGLKGDLLVAWDGTGGASSLYVYDLTKRAKALVVDGADENLEWLSPMTAAVWVTKAYAERAAAAGCPDTIPANPAKMDSLMSLDFETLRLQPTGRYRCVVGQ